MKQSCIPLCATVGLLLVAQVHGQAGPSPVGDGAAEAVLLSPTLGRPAFVPPGGLLRVTAQVPDPVGPVRFALVSERFPAHRHELAAPAQAVEALLRAEPFVVEIPAQVPEQTYDLEIRAGGARLLGKHCVAVGTVGAELRLVHLSDMNVGDLGAPGFDRRLIDEINLVAPDLIVATGDYLDVTHPDPDRGWRELLDFFTRLDAPALLACGDHEDLARYSRFVSPSPIGAIDIGRHRGIVLFDTPAGPIHEDDGQLAWLDRTLPTQRRDQVTFVVAHAEQPNLLRHWQRRGSLADMVRAGRLGLWLAGGSRDWDGREFAGVINAAAPMMFVRTHAASTASRGGASGVSHYRVVDLSGDRVVVPTESPGQGSNPPSIAVGRLTAQINGQSDGTAGQLAFTVTNGLPYRMDHLRLRLLLKRDGGQQPWCRGAEIERLVSFGRMWECHLRFDLPDRGTLRGVVGTGPEPEEPRVSVRFDLPRMLAVSTRSPSEPARVLATGAAAVVHVANATSHATTLEPLVRLDGNLVPYRLVDRPGPYAAAYALTLDAGQQAALQLDLSAVRVRPGRRELQLYDRSAYADAPQCYPLEIVVEPPRRLTKRAP